MLARSPGIDSGVGIGTITSPVWFLLAFKERSYCQMGIHMNAVVNV